MDIKFGEVYYYMRVLEEFDKERIKNIDLKAYAQGVFSLAKKLLDIEYAELVFEHIDETTFGKSDNKKTITINDKLLSIVRIGDLTQTIFHESRHIYQAKHNKIVIDSKIEPTIPLIMTDETVFYLDKIFTSTQCYNLYFTSLNEKDARDYANHMCKLLYEYLNANVQNKQPQELLSILLKANHASEIEEEKKYRESMFSLDYKFGEIKNKIKAKTHELLEKARLDATELRKLDNLNNNSKIDYADYCEEDEINKKAIHLRFSLFLLSFKLSAVVSTYCDDEIKGEIKEFCLKNKDIDEVVNIYLYLHNYPIWNTTSEDMNKVFEIALNYKIPFKELCLWLSNFDENDLAKRYAMFLTNQQVSKKQNNNKLDEKNIKEK